MNMCHEEAPTFFVLGLEIKEPSKDEQGEATGHGGQGSSTAPHLVMYWDSVSQDEEAS